MIDKLISKLVNGEKIDKFYGSDSILMHHALEMASLAIDYWSISVDQVNTTGI